ncbi:SDR family oxidoreductase [Candidatus Woesearchaeota archaeon]|nr:SDR family oxidoreductase [Candidatus Woesearchaeota archaeon]
MKFLVTGGAGFIGSHVVEHLVFVGLDVKVVDNLLTGKKENIFAFEDKISFYEQDIIDTEELVSLFENVDCVVHLAALPSVPRSIKDPLGSNKNNITGTLSVFEAARLAGVKRIIFASSSSVYGDSPKLPKEETMAPNPLSLYAVQKYTDEQYAKLYCKLFNMNIIGLRFFNVFGPRQDPHSEYSAVIPKFIKLISEDKSPTIYGDGLTSRDFTYVGNVVEAIMLATKAENVSGEIINIACGNRITLNELVDHIKKILSKTVETTYVDERVGDIKHSLADISKAKMLIGYSPKYSFSKGLEKTVNYYVS